MAVQPWYRSLTLQFKARIQELGLTMLEVDARAGLPDGYTAKALHPDSNSGRQAQYQSLQLLLETLYGPGGFVLASKPLPKRTRRRCQAEQLELPLPDPGQVSVTIGETRPLPPSPRGGWYNKRNVNQQAA